MTKENSLTRPSINSSSLLKRVLIGACIAFTVISVFLISGGEGNPGWGQFWMIRPMVIVPLAGATGGACYYFINYRFRGGWGKLATTILGALIYIFGLWLGSVLGLAGTYWN